jgi:hypothetical protein
MPELMRAWYLAMYERLFEVGRLGRGEADGSTTISVPNRPRYVYVQTGAGETAGVVTAMNIGVPLLAGTPVRMLKLVRLRLIVGLDWASPALRDIHFNVAPHHHGSGSGLEGPGSDGTLTGLADVNVVELVDGQILEFDAATGKWINVVGGGGAVDSVNGQTGVVVLDTDDIAEGATNLYLTQERVEDFVAAQFTGNTGRVQFSYNDTTGEVTAILDVSAADRILYSTAADTWAETALTSFIRTLLDDADAATARSTLGLVIGTNVQAYDAELAALAGLTSAADRLPYFTGSGTAALATFTAFGRSLVDDADAAAGRTTLGVTVYDTETAEDVVGAMVSGNTETGIAVTYDDATGKLNFDAQTAGDARYVRLTGPSTGQRITGSASTGYTLEVYRDLAAASTDSPVLGVLQDNTGDDQAAMRVQQDGTGNIIEGRDGATLVFALEDGGALMLKDVVKLSANNVVGRLIGGTAVDNAAFLQYTGVSMAADASRGNFDFHSNTKSSTTGGIISFYQYDGVSTFTLMGRFARDLSFRVYEVIRALSGSGISIVDDAGNPGVKVADGGNVGIKNATSPQGALHAHDSTSGALPLVSKTGVNATSQVIIPNGTGDVTRLVTGTIIVSDGTTHSASTFTLTQGGTLTYDVTIAGSTWRTTLNANGELSVARTAGTATATITYDIRWQ